MLPGCALVAPAVVAGHLGHDDLRVGRFHVGEKPGGHLTAQPRRDLAPMTHGDLASVVDERKALRSCHALSLDLDARRGAGVTPTTYWAIVVSLPPERVTKPDVYPEDFDMNRHIAVAPSTPTCFLGPSCSWIGPGHSMAFAQDHIADSEREGWHDSIVEELTAGGWIRLSALHGAASVLIWNHADLSAFLAVGDPVAVNAKRHVLAAGDHRFNVLVV